MALTVLSQPKTAHAGLTTPRTPITALLSILYVCLEQLCLTGKYEFEDKKVWYERGLLHVYERMA